MEQLPPIGKTPHVHRLVWPFRRFWKRTSDRQQEQRFSCLYNKSRMLTEYYHAARYGAALAEMDWYGVLKLTGSERASWLQGMVTNDVQNLVPGAGCYAAHLTPQGKIVAQMHILAAGDAFWLSLERAAVPKLAQAFDKLLIM